MGQYEHLPTFKRKEKVKNSERLRGKSWKVDEKTGKRIWFYRSQGRRSFRKQGVADRIKNTTVQ